VAATLEQARDYLREFTPDLVITDLLLPDGKGIDLFQMEKETSQLPLVVITGNGDEQLAVEAMKNGAVDYVVKSEMVLADTPHIAKRALREWDYLNERKLAEEALRKSEKRFRNFLDNMGDIAYEIDSSSKVTYVNRMGEVITGIPFEDIMGKPFLSLFKEDSRKIAADVYQRTLNGESLEYELTFTNGRICHFKNEPLRDDHGKIIGAFGTARDVAEQKQAEEALKIAKARAEAANTAKSFFLANMSHEIRTPMNAVIGFADMLLDSKLDEDQTDYARMIKKGGDGLLSLINDILDFSKIEAGELDIEEIDFDAELLAYDVCDIIRPRIGSKPIELLCRIGDNLPSNLRGDPLRFRQVLTNLMGNAAKFTKAGEIELSLDIDEEHDDWVGIHATIRDTGIGIPKDRFESIFEPFQQTDGSTTRKYGGTGLGLSICKQISNLMGGDVWAESEADKGSIFHFTGRLKKTKEKETRRFDNVSLSDKKVLIVDDNQTSLNILTFTLELVGMRVVALKSAEKVVPTLKNAKEGETPFDICITDIHMPGMSGYELVKQIRGLQSQFSNLPLVALSSSMERGAQKCEEAGFDGFLSKPIHREKLYQMLVRIIGVRGDVDKRDQATRREIITQYSVREDIKHSVRILLVEDNPVNQKLARMMLTNAGYQVEVADNGKEAVEKYTKSPQDFDLIFMDVQMPEMDGIEATKAIRRKGFDRIPVVAMTAHAMKGDRGMCLEAGMNDYISKPIKREIVFEVIEKWILNAETSYIPGDSHPHR
jgi:PAS domain S-box-containing protein